MLQTVVLYKDLDRNVVLLGPGTDSFDADDWSSITFKVPGLSISELCASAADGKNVTCTIETGDISSLTAGVYLTQLVGNDGTYDVDLGTGLCELLEGVS